MILSGALRTLCQADSPKKSIKIYNLYEVNKTNLGDSKILCNEPRNVASELSMVLWSYQHGALSVVHDMSLITDNISCFAT
jgi:hypothetical protein